jgi:hypothetical protein
MSTDTTQHILRASIGVQTTIHAKNCPACAAQYGPYKVAR